MFQVGLHTGVSLVIGRKTEALAAARPVVFSDEGARSREGDGSQGGARGAITWQTSSVVLWRSGLSLGGSSESARQGTPAKPARWAGLTPKPELFGAMAAEGDSAPNVEACWRKPLPKELADRAIDRRPRVVRGSLSPSRAGRIPLHESTARHQDRARWRARAKAVGMGAIHVVTRCRG